MRLCRSLERLGGLVLARVLHSIMRLALMLLLKAKRLPDG